jgi:tetratricopeptide (TPR) repeat protein
MHRHLLLAVVCLLLLFGTAGTARWLWQAPPEPQDAMPADLPVPPFPPRITEGSLYESCLASLADDPAGAIAIAESWQADGGGDGAAHCQGLAMIALGRPEEGAAILEKLASRSSAPPLARASVLGQAVQARLMVGQAEQASSDATLALDLSPADTELLIMRASARGALGAYQQAVDDLNQALRLDGSRTDALVSRAILWRKMGHLDLAQADVAQALTLDPDYPDALLERGILRQRMGDRAGARADWEHARGADPNSTTADLADQNLSLLEAGPRQQ